MADTWKLQAEVSHGDYLRLDELATESGRPMSLLIDDLMHGAITRAYIKHDSATRIVQVPAFEVTRHTPVEA